MATRLGSIMEMAEARIELATYRVWAGCSTTELLRPEYRLV